MMEQGGDFFENLAQVIGDDDLGRIYSDCMSDYEDDRSSRKEWKSVKEGLEFLGMKFERELNLLRVHRHHSSVTAVINNSKHRHTKRCCLLGRQDAGGGHDDTQH